MLPVYLTAENLDDAWHQSLYLCFKYGHAYKIEHGPYEGQTRYEFDFFSARIKNPGQPSCLVPTMPEGTELTPPTSKEYVQIYFAEFLLADVKSDKEDYRYGERLVNAKYRPLRRPDLSKPHEINGPAITLGQSVPILDLTPKDGRQPQTEEEWCEFLDRHKNPADDWEDKFKPDPFMEVALHAEPINQVDEVIRMFAERGGETNQATMEIAMPPDILLADSPCCRLIDCRVRSGKLHFFIYFRSWDLFSGFPANLGGMELLKQYLVNQIRDYPNHKNPKTKLPNLENGEIFAISKGLHTYDKYAEIVEAKFGKSCEEIRTEGQVHIAIDDPSMICIGI